MLNKQKSVSEMTKTSHISAEERLTILLNECPHHQLPMISLPDSDHYWSEGWKCPSDLDHNSNNDLSIVSSTSSPVSSSSASPLSSASSSPSSYFQSNPSAASQQQQQQQQQQQPLTKSQAEAMSELSAEYLAAFDDKQHLAFYGHDAQDSPLILSYRTESVGGHETKLRAILRTKETNHCITIPLANLGINQRW